MGDTGSKIDSSTGMVLEWMGNSPAITSEWFLASTYPDKLNLAINLHWGSSVVFWVPNSAHKNARNPRAKYIFSLAMLIRCLRKPTSVEITHILVKHLDWALECVCIPVDLACHYLLHNFRVSITGLAITCNLWIWTGSRITLGEDTSENPLILCNNKWQRCEFWYESFDIVETVPLLSSTVGFTNSPYNQFCGVFSMPKRRTKASCFITRYQKCSAISLPHWWLGRQQTTLGKKSL